MKAIIFRCLMVMMMMGLAACGSGGAAPTSPSSTANTNSPADNNNAQSEAAPTGLEFIHYTVKLTGAETANVEGIIETIFLEGAGRLISFAGPAMNFQAIVQTPITLQPGEYPLTQADDYRAQISTSYEPSGTYASNVSGTLKITSADPLQGTFEYSASTATAETITATGSFDEVVYSYSAKVSGDVEATMPPGKASIITLSDENVLNLDTSDPTSLLPSGDIFSIAFYMPNTTAAGDYALATTYSKPTEGQIGVIINNNGDESSSYDTNIKGTLTLIEAGQQYSGFFTVTADTQDGKTVTVEGSFTDLPVLQAQDLP